MTRWAKEASPTNILPDAKPDVPVRGNWKREFTVSKKYLGENSNSQNVNTVKGTTGPPNNRSNIYFA
jgi:hypothetical protein